MADNRFDRLKTDPRFRRPKKQQNKVVVDTRFKGVFSKKADKKAATVDKYGLAVSKSQATDNLKRFYRLDEHDHEDEPEENRLDLARGEGLLESSDEEDSSEGSDSSEDDGPVRLGKPDDFEEDEINLDENEIAHLDAQADAYSKQVPEDSQLTGETSARIAVVNLDWDHVRASHLYKIFSSLVSPTAPAKRNGADDSSSKSAKVVQGSILDVTVYPSEFGKERMAREDTEGPPTEVFKKKKKSEEINAETIYELGGEEDVDENALRKYQLERLRYPSILSLCQPW